LNTLTAGKPDGWTVEAVQPSALTFNDTGAFVQITNGGNSAADLSQKLAVKPGDQFALELQATALQPTEPPASASMPNARLELRWFDAANALIPPPPRLDIAPGAFDISAATGVVPDKTASAEIHLLIPGGVTLNTTAISLQLASPASVLISFVAQSPGSLTVSAMNVAYEPAPPVHPPIPPGGLCPPTPPPQAVQASSNSCYCCCCETQTRMKNPTPTTTPGGKPATTGTCSQCGATVTTTGGQLTPGLTAIPATFTYTHSTVPVTTEQLVAVIERLQTSSGQVAKAQLSQITGIGPARASQLQAAGISTLRQLADATKETVAATLEGPGMSLDLAQSFIDQAKKLLEEGHPT
jgi:predicted flap endonuclease-1-like 5' DNA nuclease